MSPKAKGRAKTKAKARVKDSFTAEQNQIRKTLLEDFRAFDLNGDGILQKAELKALLKVLDPKTWTDEQVDRLMVAFDKDGDGVITLEEFVDWVTGDTGDADHEAFTTTLNKGREDAATTNRIHAERELTNLIGVDMLKEIKGISDTDLTLLVQASAPLEPLHRLLALVSLLLEPSKTKASGKPVDFNPPTWPAVQRLVRDSSFLQRVQNVDARRKELKETHSAVAAYAVEHYFCLLESEDRPSPLSLEELLEASQKQFGRGKSKSGPALILYKWCLALLEYKLRDLARDRTREQARREFNEEIQKEMEQAEKMATDNLASVKAEATEALDKVDDLLSCI